MIAEGGSFLRKEPLSCNGLLLPRLENRCGASVRMRLHSLWFGRIQNRSGCRQFLETAQLWGKRLIVISRSWKLIYAVREHGLNKKLMHAAVLGEFGVKCGGH